MASNRRGGGTVLLENLGSLNIIVWQCIGITKTQDHFQHYITISTTAACQCVRSKSEEPGK